MDCEGQCCPSLSCIAMQTNCYSSRKNPSPSPGISSAAWWAVSINRLAAADLPPLDDLPQLFLLLPLEDWPRGWLLLGWER